MTPETMPSTEGMPEREVQHRALNPERRTERLAEGDTGQVPRSRQTVRHWLNERLKKRQ